MEQESQDRVLVSLDQEDIKKLDEIKNEIGIRQRPETIRFLISFYFKTR